MTLVQYLRESLPIIISELDCGFLGYKPQEARVFSWSVKKYWPSLVIF